MAFTLNQPVGNYGGVKAGPDVLKVQRALNNVPPNEGGAVPPLDTDSICGPKTLKAIQTFQLKHFGWKGADGRVDVMGPTHQKLNGYYSDGITSPTPGQPSVPTGPEIEPIDPSPEKSESFSIRINAPGDLKSTLDIWRVLITDEANQRSKRFRMRKPLDLYTDNLFEGWSSAYYFRRSQPTALEDFLGAGIRFGSVLVVDPSKESIEVNGFDVTFDNDKRWWNRLALHLRGDSWATVYNDTPFRLYDCLWEAKNSPNRDNVYEKSLTGNLMELSPSEMSVPMMASRGPPPNQKALRDEAEKVHRMWRG